MIDNISQATLDVIEAIKTNQTVKFNYGTDIPREIKPTGFYGDFNGFEGTDETTDAKEFRRFAFDKITDWYGVSLPYRVYVEMEVLGHPSDNDIRQKMYEILKDEEELLYKVEPIGLV
tara:strand:- start:338 stop:691 length:354 start_codon:yes stop_codon:yes gene_type:complete